MIVWVYNRWGEQTGCLHDFVEFAHDDELGSLDTVEFMTPGGTLSKGDHLLWRDSFGIWHEHIVASAELVHFGDAVYQSIYALNSISELNQSYIDERNSYGFTNSVAMTRLLENTRWEPGTVNNLGTADIKFYHETVYDGLVDLAAKWGGDITATITVGPDGVTRRAVNHLAKCGEDNGLIFTYGFDMDNISRTEELDEVYTRIHCFGKGEELYDEQAEADQQNARYGRRITFADINGGKDYVEDDQARLLYGVVGRNGAIQHSEGTYIFGDIEDPYKLLEAGKAKLAEVKSPRVTYSANVAVLADAGMDFKNARKGDTVYIRDETLGERLTGRVMRVRRYAEDGKATEITLGNVVRTYYDMVKDQQKTLDSLTRRSASWDGAANSAEPWIDRMIDGLNEFMNSVSGFVYWEQGEGITVYDRAKEENPTMAIQLKGGMFRIANSKKANGEWDWRTFGTGDGFTADVLNTGEIRGGSNRWNLETGDLYFKQGSIQCANGAYWNIGNGDFETIFTIKESLRVGSSTVSTYLQDVLCVDMDTRTPFGVYRGSREKYVDARTGEVTYSTVTDKSLVGGTVLSDDKSEVYFRGTRVGISDTNYITTGVTTNGYNGASFLSRGTEYLTEVALAAVDDPNHATSGVGFKTCGRTFMDVSTYSGYRHVRLFVPTTDDFIDAPDPSLYLASPNTTAARVSLTRNSNSYLNIASDRLSLMYATGKYVSIDDTAARLVHAVDGSGNITRGVYLSSSSSSFIHSSAQRLNISSTSTYLQHSSSRELRLSSSGTYLCDAVDSDNNITRGIYFSSSSTTLKHTASRQIVMDSNGVSLQYSSTRYIYISSSSIVMRNGSSGLRLNIGATTWEPVTFD